MFECPIWYLYQELKVAHVNMLRGSVVGFRFYICLTNSVAEYKYGKSRFIIEFESLFDNNQAIKSLF